MRDCPGLAAKLIRLSCALEQGWVRLTFQRMSSVVWYTDLWFESIAERWCVWNDEDIEVIQVWSRLQMLLLQPASSLSWAELWPGPNCCVNGLKVTGKIMRQLSSSGSSEELETCLRAQSQGHYTIDHLEERCVERGNHLEDRCVERASAQQSSLKRSTSILDIRTVSKVTLGNLLRQVGAQSFLSQGHSMQSWTELYRDNRQTHHLGWVGGRGNILSVLSFQYVHIVESLLGLGLTALTICNLHMTGMDILRQQFEIRLFFCLFSESMKPARFYCHDALQRYFRLVHAFKFLKWF